MNLDAAGRDARNTYRDQKKEWRGGYVPGFNPDGPLYHPSHAPHYDDDLRVASRYYWVTEHKMQGPPPPSFEGEKLGRLMDVYGCQAMMRRALHDWRKMFWQLVLIAGILLFMDVEMLPEMWFFLSPLILAGIIGVAAYRFSKKRVYMKYYEAQYTALQSKKPVWVPYEKSQIERMNSDERFQWP